MLKDKSLTELRTIAHGLGVSDIFSKAPHQLIQDIEQKNKDLIPRPSPPPPQLQFINARATDMCDAVNLRELLQPFIDRGLSVEINDEGWKFWKGIKMDTGTLKMPLKTVLRKAQEVLS